MSDETEKAKGSKRIKVISTVLVFGAVILQLWTLVGSVPSFLNAAVEVTAVVLAIHAVEGLISALLILRYRLRSDKSAMPNSLLAEKLPSSTPLAVVKAGLYGFFVGTIGLSEVIEATKPLKASS